MSLGNVVLNPPLHTQHREGVGGCNVGNPNVVIRCLGGGADHNEAEISNEVSINSNIKH